MEQKFTDSEVEIMLDDMARVFKAMGDPLRIRILGMLISGERCACMFHEALNVPQNLVSHHLKVLQDNQIIVGRKEGRFIYYSLDDERIDTVRIILGSLIGKGETI